MVDLAQELGCHHFVRAVLDETCDVQEACREAQAEKATVKKKTTKKHRPPCRGSTDFVLILKLSSCWEVGVGLFFLYCIQYLSS